MEYAGKEEYPRTHWIELYVVRHRLVLLSIGISVMDDRTNNIKHRLIHKCTHIIIFELSCARVFFFLNLSLVWMFYVIYGIE